MEGIRHLRRRIVLLCSLLTGVVLLASCLAGYRLTASQSRLSFSTLLETQYNTIESQVRSNHSVSVTEIYHFETGSGMLVQLYDNGVPLHIEVRSPSDTRKAVLTMAEDGLPWQAPGPEADSHFIQLDAGQHGRWMGLYRTLTSRYGSWYGVLVLKPMDALDNQLMRAKQLYAGVFLAGFVLLGAVSLLLAHLAVQPMRRAQQQQLDFIAAAGHDLKTPLAVIQSSAEMLERDPAAMADYQRNIVAETHRMGRLVGDLLLLSGSRGGRLPVYPARVDSDTLLISVFERAQPLARQQGRTLALRLPDSPLPPVRADDERVVQILGILLDNAFTYSTPGTGVELAAEAGCRRLAIHVQDHGPGVAGGEAARIFASFYRGDASRTAKGHYGLGLSIARQLAQSQKGSLQHSPTPGGGATFTLTLPLWRE